MLRFSFGGGLLGSVEDLRASLAEQLGTFEARHGLPAEYPDAHIRFALLTGVSKFSKVSIFSDLNNLNDITLDAPYSAICGYTEHDIDTVFAPELPGLDREVAPETLLSSFDVDHIATEALLFQAGHLTIDRVEEIPGLAQVALRYPNLKVRTALNGALLPALTGHDSHYAVQMGRLYRLLQAGDVAGLREVFHAFFATVPHDWHRANPIARYEGYWASVCYSHFAALGLDIVLEDVTSHGRMDMAVRLAQRVYLFEFKVVELVPEGRALQQLQDRGYADKYRATGQAVHLVGIEFSRDERNIVGFETLAL
ncbi:hypothetical protein GCM10027019_09140 [Melaminivora jejuensis]|uniref:PD-(D/E)XK nuclease domain-containing protein n=1 Tax=Melaminivora jejuensis TaxID=1267217 RepID=UPI001E5D8963|nr:AAA family ATPase [Melaminivora jejuensis]UHJ64244.1 ATP-binding protein [Melaminivora jejuensis]